MTASFMALAFMINNIAC